LASKRDGRKEVVSVAAALIEVVAREKFETSSPPPNNGGLFLLLTSRSTFNEIDGDTFSRNFAESNATGKQRDQY
jgi:hypothetical protein